MIIGLVYKSPIAGRRGTAFAKIFTFIHSSVSLGFTDVLFVLTNTLFIDDKGMKELSKQFVRCETEP